MGAMKALEVDIMEMVEEELVELGLNIEEIVELYDNAGGDRMYDMWCHIYADGLIEKWFNERSIDTSDETKMFVEGIVCGLTNYIKWLKTLN